MGAVTIIQGVMLLYVGWSYSGCQARRVLAHRLDRVVGHTAGPRCHLFAGLGSVRTPPPFPSPAPKKKATAQSAQETCEANGRVA